MTAIPATTNTPSRARKLTANKSVAIPRIDEENGTSSRNGIISPQTIASARGTSTPGIEVDEHAIAVCRYARGLSRLEARWGTFTDPWTHQPQPACGFTFVGSDGTIVSPDHADHVTVQTRARPARHAIPVDPPRPGERDAIEYVLGCIARGVPVGGPLDPALCLTGQGIVDTARASADQKRTLALLP